MKNKYLIVSIALLLSPLLPGQAVLAGKDKSNSQGASNGQPFLNLQAAIDAETAALQAAVDAEAAARAAADAAEAATRAAADAREAADRSAADQLLSADIAANASAIADLNAAVGNINAQIAAIDLDITRIEGDVQGILGTLAALNVAVTQLATDAQATQADIADLFSDLGALEATHRADKDALQAQIDSQLVLLNALRTDLDAATLSLQNQLDTLQTAVASNSGDITTLLVQVATTLTDIVTINGALDDHETRLQTLEGALGSIDIRLSAAQAAIFALEADVLALQGTAAHLQSLHAEDPQCSEPYTTLNDARRNVTTINGAIACDNGLATGWYRFEGAAGTHIPTSVVSTYRCGTHAPGWMNGVLPAAADGVVSRQVCYNWDGNACNWSNTIQVVSCNDFTLYHLSQPPVCNLRYCGEN